MINGCVAYDSDLLRKHRRPIKIFALVGQDIEGITFQVRMPTFPPPYIFG